MQNFQLKSRNLKFPTPNTKKRFENYHNTTYLIITKNTEIAKVQYFSNYGHNNKKTGLLSFTSSLSNPNLAKHKHKKGKKKRKIKTLG